tara:strand:+ start:1616 stop:2083 length:468 start_codon:yes stop_codon:yes gene_type:complete
MSFFKNHICIFSILFFILSGCNLQDPNKTHGIVFLENRAAKLILNKTNKNDTIKLIGQPQIKGNNSDNTWIYLERTLAKGKFHKLGKHILVNNNVLVLEFNKYGVLRTKELLKKEDIKKLEFAKEKTFNDLSKKSFVQSFLESVKQKMYSNRKSN